MDLRGKVAIVTGAGRDGSGRAIASRLARAGAPVVASDINEAGGRETVRQIESAGGRAAFCAGDVRSEEQVRRLVRFAEDTFGGLHVMVNNASATVHFDEPLEHWADAIQTDLFGAIYGTRAAIEAMRRGGGGAVVNVSSISALWHGRKGGSPAYDVAKAGVIRLTTTLGWLAEKENIRVNCLAPGWIATAELRAFWEPLTPEERRARGAPDRLLSLEQVADAVLRLATDETLAGRVLVWWSEDEPGLIPWRDQGYMKLDPW